MTEAKAPLSIAIVGPTASGKSGLALALAKECNGEIVSCDSVQVYKDFDIGSAKPTPEERASVPHHMIDLVTWKESFDAAQYRTLALPIIEDIQKRKRVPIIVGGTGLYFRALCGQEFHDLPHDETLRKQLEEHDTPTLYKKLQQLDPKRAAKLHPNDRFRIARACEITLLTGRSLESLSEDKTTGTFQPTLTVFCNPKREILLERIRLRTETMLKEGLVAEVRALLAAGCIASLKPMQSIGYRQVCDVLQGRLEDKDLQEKIIIATRQYARKQGMWFKSTPIDLRLADPYSLLNALDEIKKSIDLRHPEPKRGISD